MTSRRHQLDSYRKALLNRVTANSGFTEYIENTLAREEEATKHAFHKIMVHNWSGSDSQLFDTISEYFSSALIPVQHTCQSTITSFYTSNLGLILKIIKLDFMFPFQRNMFNVDIVFNDKTSTDCFQNLITIEDIVSSVVSGRFSEKLELNLSNFCNDPEFEDKKISFYKLSLLSHFKILMLRMGRDTTSLNLSNNNLSQVPLDILNFFIKGGLTAINLSDNQIPSLQELLRVSSKIEKLWLEGNPLCEHLDPAGYVKVITMKFPRVIELDGVRINEHGCTFPFLKNYLVTPDRQTRIIVENFLSIYFTHYDVMQRKRIEPLYSPYAVITINTVFTERDAVHAQAQAHAHAHEAPQPAWRARIVRRRALVDLPPTAHDPTTFSVDVLLHDSKVMVLVVDGIFREPIMDQPTETCPPEAQYRYYSFRRTFVFAIKQRKSTSEYHIVNEIFTPRPATREQIESSFKEPMRNLNELSLMNPDADEIDAIVKALMHLTNLKRSEAEARLKLNDWDIRKALKMFLQEFRENKISPEKMVEDDDFSDHSSLVDDEID